jgi:hypothetical protein
MRESVLLHEESLRLQRMCRDLKKRDHLSTFLRRAHDAALSAYTRALGDDEFGEALDPPPILGRFSLFSLSLLFFLFSSFYTSISSSNNTT